MAKNTRQQGNRGENAFMVLAEGLGYACFAARGSRGPVDVICFIDGTKWSYAPHHPPLVVQVGTKAKPIAATLRELQEAPRPIGSLCLVARKTKLKNRRVAWKFSTQAGTFSSLSEALEAR